MLASAVKELLDGILCRSRHKTRSLVFSDSCRNRNILFKTPEWGDIYVFNLFLIGNYQDIILSTNMESHIYPKLLFSIYIYTLLVCLTVRLYPINGGTDRAQIFVGPHMTPGKVYGCSKLQKFVSTNFLFLCEILKMREKILWIPQTFVEVHLVLL